MIGTGTIVNILAVIIGSAIGLIFKGGIKQRFQDTLMQALGLCVMFIGVGGALKGIFVINGSGLETTGTMIMILSLVIGGIIGELINIEKWLDVFGKWIKIKVRVKNDNRFVDGFVTASLIICVGAMAVVGSLQDGLTGDASMLYTKSALDFVFIIITASTLGIGVMFSAIPLAIYQGAITVLARFIQPFLTTQVISNLSFVGSILIFGIGVNLSFGKKFKVGNLLPSLIITLIASTILD
ncbi:MAG: DUF554 domain-containing protein [Oscillospiraceae bacterium]|nr:DUF554 domain-containing protein [Oscillospiraceae bacterium]